MASVNTKIIGFRYATLPHLLLWSYYSGRGYSRLQSGLGCPATLGGALG